MTSESSICVWSINFLAYKLATGILSHITPKDSKAPAPKFRPASVLAGNKLVGKGTYFVVLTSSFRRQGESWPLVERKRIALFWSLYVISAPRFLTLATQKWSVLETLNNPTPRYGHTLNITAREIFVFGGESTNEPYLNDLHQIGLQDLTSSSPKWTLLDIKGPKPQARSGHVCVSDGRKLILFIHPSTIRWLSTADLEGEQSLCYLTMSGFSFRHRNYGFG